MIGWIVIAIGAIIILLTGLVAGHEDPRTTRQATLIGLGVMAVGLVLKLVLGV
jgi:hypothetical protein